jgi:hypothetical protein
MSPTATASRPGSSPPPVNGSVPPDVGGIVVELSSEVDGPGSVLEVEANPVVVVEPGPEVDVVGSGATVVDVVDGLVVVVVELLVVVATVAQSTDTVKSTDVPTMSVGPGIITLNISMVGPRVRRSSESTVAMTLGRDSVP